MTERALHLHTVRVNSLLHRRRPSGVSAGWKKKNMLAGASREAAGRWRRKRPTDEQLIANIYKAPPLKCTVQSVFALSNGDLQTQCVCVWGRGDFSPEVLDGVQWVRCGWWKIPSTLQKSVKSVQNFAEWQVYNFFVLYISFSFLLNTFPFVNLS